MTEEQYEKVIIPRIKQLREICEDKGVTPITLYNADQTGLFYQKLPNSLYIEKLKKKITKAMEYKTRDTAML